MLKRELVRLPYLARLMIEDLEGAERLFCFHDAGHSGPEQIAPLMEALSRYGSNWLLWICPATGEAAPGSAERFGERLIRGYIDNFQPLHHVKQPSFGSWIHAIRAAHAIWQADR